MPTFAPKNGRRRLTLPRLRLVCVLALLDKYERMDKDVGIVGIKGQTRPFSTL